MLPDEHREYAREALVRLINSSAFVPALWHVQVRNVLAVGERRKRLTQVESQRFLAALIALPVETDAEPVPSSLDRTLDLARQPRYLRL